LLLLVTARRYDPGEKSTGKLAAALWLVKDTRVSGARAKASVGGRPDGLKFEPVTVT